MTLDFAPMLADRGFPRRDLAGWAAEPKLDGWRAIVVVDAGTPTSTGASASRRSTARAMRGSFYLKIPGMRQQGTLKPTEEGTAIAKDSWLLGIGLSLLTSGLQRDREC